MSQENNPLSKPLKIDDIRHFADDLKCYQTIFHQLFQRKEQKQHADDYIQGLLSQLPNKSIETMMLHTKGPDKNKIRAMQNFISEGTWDDRPIIRRHWEEINSQIGEDDAAIIVDGSGFPKQGEESVGVARQWCGQLGKRANCQVGLFLGYASQKGRTLLDHRLYMPEQWFEEEFALKRERCGVPEEIVFETKLKLAADMITEMAQSKTVRFRWIVADEEFGRDSKFLDQVGSVGTYFVEIPHDTHVWLTRPETYVPEWSGKGRKPILEKLKPDEPNSQPVSTIAAQIESNQWQPYLVKEGSKGPIIADFIALRVVNRRKQLPCHDIWLILRRNLTTGEIKYYLSNATAIGMTCATFAAISGRRWPIETCFEEGKQELGFGDYQVRTWTGWHHHMTFVILAHGFLLRINQKMEPDVKLTFPQIILLLKAALPQPQVGLEQAVDIVNYYQERHESARHSHRKKRLEQLKQIE